MVGSQERSIPQEDRTEIIVSDETGVITAVERNHTIDILKGIAILLVVLGHTRFVGTNYIYLFHMAVFFMASGYFYKDKYSDSLKCLWAALFKRIRSLYVPYLVWNTVFTLLNNILIKINIYTSDETVRSYLDESLVSIHNNMSLKEMIKNIAKGFLFAGRTELGGAFWFLRVLFYISVCYLVIDFILKRFIKKRNALLICQGMISLVFLIVGFLMGLKNINTFAIDKLFSCYCLYYIGMLLSEIKPGIFDRIPVCVIIVILCFAALFCMSKAGTVSLGDNDYVNPIFMLAASGLGWFMTYGISVIISKADLLKAFFSLLGKNSMIIVIFHFLCFKPVNILVASVKAWPLQTIAGFPVSCNTGFWWILYTAVSTALCLLIALIWNRLKKIAAK